MSGQRDGPAVALPGKELSNLLNRRLDGFHLRYVSLGEEKSLLPLPGVELRLLRCSPHQLLM